MDTFYFLHPVVGMSLPCSKVPRGPTLGPLDPASCSPSMPVICKSCLCAPWASATPGPSRPASFKVSIKCHTPPPSLGLHRRRGCLWHVVIHPLPGPRPLEVEAGGSCLPAAAQAITHRRHQSVPNNVYILIHLSTPGSVGVSLVRVCSFFLTCSTYRAQEGRRFQGPGHRGVLGMARLPEMPLP